jgi:peptide/nickel transport system substrate-binding protein
MGSVVRHLNPAVQAAPVNTVGVQIFAGLVRFDSGWEPQPYLAESWTWQDDGKSLLVRLVKGATFHDGRPITSEDVAFSIMAVKASHPFNTMLAPVERVDTPSPQLAIIRLRQEHPALLLALAPALCPIMPKHVYGEGQELRSHPRNADPVGSGPFRVTAFEPGRHVTLERHRGFFLKDRLRLDRLIYRVIPDPSVQVLEIEKGDVQMLVGPVTVSQAGQLAKSPKVSIVARGGEAIGPVGWLEMNLRRKPYDDPRVRRAIAYAIDKDFIVRTLHRGATQAATGPIAPGSPFHFGKVEAYKHDLAKANRLLDEAGLARNAQGVRFAMTLDYQPGIPDNYQLIAEYLRPQLKKAGIDVTIRVSPDFPTWAKRVSNWEHDATMSGSFMWGDLVIGVHRTWVSSNIRQGVIFSNTQGYSSSKVDELLARAGAERNLERRKAQYADFQKLLAEDVPVVFTHIWARRYAVRDDVENLPQGIWGVTVPFDTVSRKGS